VQRFQTPLIISVTNTRGYAITEFLIDNGADVNATVDDLGVTALHIACKESNDVATKLLLQSGADPIIVDSNCRSVLHYAVTGSSLEVIRRLLKRTKGALINAADESGYTPLMVACEQGRLEVVQLLLEQRADPTMRNRLNHQAIELADWFGHRKVVEELEGWLRRAGVLPDSGVHHSEGMVPQSPAATMTTPLPMLMSPTAATPTSHGDMTFGEGTHASSVTGGGASDPLGAQLQTSGSAVPFSNQPAVLTDRSIA
jgi:ankyrin repeat protein